ncbi:hypothetical protein BGZ54_000851 [Gamsiella multidivaricata]|nr:hypothetical protein BGZ54_000851 [Gamsiella multidivaricata]
MTATSPLHQPALKDSPVPTVSNVYPSPSLSPATTFFINMQQQTPAAFSPRRPSVKALLSSSNPPASPLDALVMALEATVEEEEGTLERDQSLVDGTGVNVKTEEDDDDPDATIPSSPTVFMKRPSAEPSLHHLPTMMLPESVAMSALQSQSSGLTPSTLPNDSSRRSLGQRKMSISSQGSSSSANSNSERTKEYACTVGNCEKKFYQVAHLRSHER